MDNHYIDDVVEAISGDKFISDSDKALVLRNLSRLKKTKVNILITGATGSGKSSTVNALFNSEKAKVGQGADPETMNIIQYEMDNIVIFDSPGLGDGKEADKRHSKNIIDKLYEKDRNGELLIDLVLVVLDGGSRDLGTSFELINSVVIPHLGEDKSRLLVAINQADMAMKGRCWDHCLNQPETALVDFLHEKVSSTKRRIKEATGVEIEPIYYAAGYKDGDDSQKPYNLSKLLLFILRSVKKEKRAVIVQDVNTDKDMWEDDDCLEDYRNEINETFIDSVKNAATQGASIGSGIGRAVAGSAGEAVGKVVGTVVGGIIGAVFSFF